MVILINFDCFAITYLIQQVACKLDWYLDLKQNFPVKIQKAVINVLLQN